MQYDQLSPVPPLTPVTRVLIVSCIAMYFVDFVLYHLGFQIAGLNLNEIFGLVPRFVSERGWLWQFVTYMFFHGHPLHLLLNMLILWYFGAEIEMRLGKGGFLRYYFICGIGAGLFNYTVNYIFSDVSKLSHPIIGASGAIFGVLAAYGMFFSNRYFLVLFVFPMKAKYFVLVMAALELIMGVEANSRDNVAHFAHVGGMVIGALYIYLSQFFSDGGKGERRRKDSERERLKKQFTLIVNQSGEKKSSSDKGPYWN